ncbi:NAD(P)-dependent oxidoreductase [Bradyrhizobium sp. CER78]|uniref:NAD-dependent epimerase/dehydratase family protein n=1 Tax=Bradyrhizobium sp. CER78 TaxID=3039162 RepID=UPI002448C650|nr:NAD(P)-dependent oxidoreductase [Bradyrhizobium sp. CER78]MDH2382192.1 NAD(P)-dependent oxidoreductase [Bradyrhizobium sp. CER78]
MRILLTGGTGFVGSVLARRLVASGHELFCVCRPEASVAFGTKVDWDGTRQIEAGTFPEGVDAVVHAAQSRNYRQFTGDSREMFAVNVGMTMLLLDWAAQSAVKQFCLISSGAVYEPFGGALHEDSALAPTGFLGSTKLASEVIAKPFSKLFGLSILRLFFPYGPGQHGRLVPDLIRRVRQGSPVQLSGDAEGLRLTPTFVDDVVEVILASIASSWSGTVNVAAPETLSIRQVACSIGRELGTEPKFEITSGGAAVDMTPDLNRLAARYDLSRFTRFDEGVRRMLACASDQPVSAQ